MHVDLFPLGGCDSTRRDRRPPRLRPPAPRYWRDRWWRQAAPAQLLREKHLGHRATADVPGADHEDTGEHGEPSGPQHAGNGVLPRIKKRTGVRPSRPPWMSLSAWTLGVSRVLNERRFAAADSGMRVSRSPGEPPQHGAAGAAAGSPRALRTRSRSRLSGSASRRRRARWERLRDRSCR